MSDSKLRRLSDKNIKTMLRNMGMPEDVMLGSGIYKYKQIAQAQLEDDQDRIIKAIDASKEKIAEFLWDTYKPANWVKWKLASNLYLVEETRQKATLITDLIKEELGVK